MSDTAIDGLLDDCVGFRVEMAAVRVGVVEQVLFGAEHQRPAALAVRSGRFGRGLRIIDADEVEAVDVAERRIRVRSAGTPVAL